MGLSHASLRRLAWLPSLAVLLAGSALAQRPAPPPLSGDQVFGLYNTGTAVADSAQCEIDETNPFPTPDLEAARTLAHAAAMLDVTARNYLPAPRTDAKAHAGKLAALILHATRVYEQAYRCAPGYDQRHLLTDAIALITARLTAIREIEKRPEKDPDYDSLSLRRSELEKLVPQPPLPPPVDPEVPKPPEPKPQPEPSNSGYARYAGHFVLRPELGVGSGKLSLDPDEPNRFTGAYAQLFLAARFTRPNKYHAFLIGGVLNIQQIPNKPGFDDESAPRSLSGGGLRIEGALHLHPRWFSLHPALELGATVYVGYEKWGRPYIGPGLGFCLDRELACIGFKFSAPLALPSQTDARAQFIQVGLGIDIMRIVDRAKGLASPP